MAPPKVNHAGFLIPNAKDVTATVLAEPDKIDFATIANSRWGVIEGCQVNPQGGTLIGVTEGTAVVNGKLVHVNETNNIPVTVPNAQNRFDLIVVNGAGNVLVLPGDQSDDPVFSDPEVGMTVLASIYCTATSSDYTNNLIDKRKFLPSSLFAKMPVGDDLIRNVNASGNHFRVLGDGKMSWEDDTTLRRSSGATLEIADNLNLLGDLAAGDDINASGDIHASATISGSNLRRGTDIPLGTYQPGDLFQQTNNGRLYLWVGPSAGGSWQELVTSAGSVPIGTIIMSLAPPASLAAAGWCPMDGKVHYANDFPGLFTIPALAPLIIPGTPPLGMTVPNLNKRMLMVDDTGVGQTGGVNDGTVKLTTANLPSHHHSVGGTGATRTTSTFAGFTPTGTIASSTISGDTDKDGGHQHRMREDPHFHIAAALNGVGTEVIAVHNENMFGTSDPGGQNKIDALFNDRSHTFSVEDARYTMPKKTWTATMSEQSEHSHHFSSGSHTHSITWSTGQGSHSHTFTEQSVGGDQSFSVMPAYYTVYAYIKG